MNIFDAQLLQDKLNNDKANQMGTGWQTITRNSFLANRQLQDSVKGLFGIKSPLEQQAEQQRELYKDFDPTDLQSLYGQAQKMFQQGYYEEGMKLLQEANNVRESLITKSKVGKESLSTYGKTMRDIAKINGLDLTKEKDRQRAEEIYREWEQAGRADTVSEAEKFYWRSKLKNEQATLDRATKGTDKIQGRFLEKQDETNQVVEDVRLIDEQIAAIKSGDVATGMFAELESGFDNILAELGLSKGDVAAATGKYKARAGQLVGQVIKLFGAGTGLSDADRKYAADMVAGSPTLQKEGILGILKALRAASERKVDRWNKTVERRSDKFYDSLDFSSREDFYIQLPNTPEEDQVAPEPLPPQLEGELPDLKLLRKKYDL